LARRAFLAWVRRKSCSPSSNPLSIPLVATLSLSEEKNHRTSLLYPLTPLKLFDLTSVVVRCILHFIHIIAIYLNLKRGVPRAQTLNHPPHKSKIKVYNKSQNSPHVTRTSSILIYIHQSYPHNRQTRPHFHYHTEASHAWISSPRS